ncbi:MAG TPA: rhomboid family intramembrane serine protease [Chthoniobacterales bacterium]
MNARSLPVAPVTKWLMAACVAGFAGQVLLGTGQNGMVEVFLGLSGRGLAAGFWWQPVTYLFLHGGVLHLLMNMVGLWFAGREVEYTFGRARYLATFFAGGILGGFLQVALAGNPDIPLVGASASVCAVLLAFTAIYPNLPITALLFFVVPVQLKAKYLGYLVLGISLVLGVTGIQPGIGHYAHLGGGLAGLLAACWLGFGRGFLPRFSFLRRRSVDAGGLTVPPPEAENLDAILHKVIRHGLHTLTPEERAVLERWNRRRR